MFACFEPVSKKRECDGGVWLLIKASRQRSGMVLEHQAPANLTPKASKANENAELELN